MLLTELEVLALLARAQLHRFTAADCEAFPEFEPEDDALIGEHEAHTIILDLDGGGWLMVYKTDENRTLAFMRIIIGARPFLMGFVTGLRLSYRGRVIWSLYCNGQGRNCSICPTFLWSTTSPISAPSSRWR